MHVTKHTDAIVFLSWAEVGAIVLIVTIGLIMAAYLLRGRK